MHKNEITNLKKLFKNSVEKYGNRTAFFKNTEDDKIIEISYRQFYDNVNALGTALIDMGLKGKRIAIIGKNSYEWCLSYLSVINGAGVVVPLDRELTQKELLDSIERAEIDVIIHSEDVEEKINKVRKNCRVNTYISFRKNDTDFYIYDLVKKGEKLISSGDHKYINSHIDDHEMIALLFTSGTTSISKIVMLSHYNITYDVIYASIPCKLMPTDKFFSILPLHHTFECTAGFLIPLYSGSSIYFSKGHRYLLEEFKKQQPSIIVCVPRVIDAISANIRKGIQKKNMTSSVKRLVRLTDLLDGIGVKVKRNVFNKVHKELGGKARLFVCGAASANENNIKNMIGLGFNVFQGYGLTECSPVVTINSFGVEDVDSIGVPIGDTRVKIDEPDSNGVGEILVKGPQVMLGYYNNPEETKKVIRDGYFYTGDLGYIKPNGCLKIVGRRKNIIVTSSGKNIYPEELEPMLLECEHIKEVVVYGDEEKENIIITAEIVLECLLLSETDNSEEKEKIISKIWEHVEDVNSNLSKHKHIQRIKIRDKEFDKTSTLKIKRH